MSKNQGAAALERQGISGITFDLAALKSQIGEENISSFAEYLETLTKETFAFVSKELTILEETEIPGDGTELENRIGNSLFRLHSLSNLTAGAAESISARLKMLMHMRKAEE